MSSVNVSADWPAAPPRLPVADWIDFLLHQKAVDGLTPPAMPSVAMQDQFVGSNGRAALNEASIFCEKLREAAMKCGQDTLANCRLLDFGVGWGRLYRILLNHCTPHSLIGVDIDSKCVQLCSEAMPYGTFQLSGDPPLSFAPATFDIVYAYSVFSHLAEHAFRTYMSEFARILKPGGLVVFTTLKGPHLDAWHRLSTGSDPWYVEYLKRAGFDHEGWLARRANGEFLYVPTGGGDMRDSSFYGEAVVTEKFLIEKAPELGLSVVAFEERDEMPQAFVVLQRPSN
ncbi:class I SAM-dependent methyltransferase [Variovorax sp. J2P1-59]|uniref:class I SAM-dependent methyltransferase n=1 Tax=Variovorax flavidus TaxID=3053501 RepID=UPI0025765900|nr:class I SAM-dependent methyltransferase [Variovorax sp. J2P1-59]MDM0076644.1 class I SAM-dependent methyltransferase [Variovorax sp. J2P1-59]